MRLALRFESQPKDILVSSALSWEPAKTSSAASGEYEIVGATT